MNFKMPSMTELKAGLEKSVKKVGEVKKGVDLTKLTKMLTERRQNKEKKEEIEEKKEEIKEEK